jgi:hypothetical protein
MSLKVFPLTANGKVDRNAFPPPTGQRPYLAKEYVAAKSELEKRFAALWCEVLHLDRVGVEDSFFIDRHV